MGLEISSVSVWIHFQAHIVFIYVHACLCKSCDAIMYSKKGWPWESRNNFDSAHFQNHTFPFITMLATPSFQPCSEKIPSVGMLGSCHWLPQSSISLSQLLLRSGLSFLILGGVKKMVTWILAEIKRKISGQETVSGYHFQRGICCAVTSGH